MPKLDGFEVLELVGRDVAVVFVTAYDQYAIRAFEVHAVDYSAEAVQPRASRPTALHRARANGCGEASVRRSRNWPRDGAAVPRAPDACWCATDRASTCWPPRRSTTCRRRTTTSRFRCEGKEYLKEQTLGAGGGERSIRRSSSGFTGRILLNLDRLARVELDERESRVAVLTDGRRLPVSRSGYARLSARL